MNRLSLILIILLVAGLASCKSHKANVVRVSGKPTAAATVTPAPAVPKNAASKKDYANDKNISNELVKQARTWIGTPYRYGANTKKKGTDCSGLTMSLFKDVANLSLPRNSAAQCEYCFNVPRNSIQPGDLIFFTSSTRGGKVSHVGLYIGNGKMIHASTSRGVIESGLDEKYYASHYHSSGRVYGITYAATGNKTPKSADAKDIQLASEGINAATPKETNKTNKPDKTNKANRANKSTKSTKSTKTTKTGASAVAVVPATKPAAPPAVEMSLDEFVAQQQSKPLADTICADKRVIEGAVAALDSVATVVDSITVTTPTKIVNDKRVEAAQVEKKPEKKSAPAVADTIRAEAIKEEVVKAMKFGK